MSKIIILDTETTGVCSTDQIIELAYLELPDVPTFLRNEIKYDSIFNERFRPDVPIHPKAVEVHGITYKDLLHCRKSDFVEIPKDVTYLVGHNIQFDHRMLGKPELKLLCTLNLSKRISKFLGFSVENHTLDHLVEVLPKGLDKKVFEKTKHHSAKNDILKNIIVLQELLKMLPNIKSWDELYELQESLGAKRKKK